MFCFNPGVMAAGAQGKTYEDWLAHIESRAPNLGLEANSAQTLIASTGSNLSRVQMTATGTTGSMSGSPHYGSGESDEGIFDAGASIRRILQHALPSQAEFNAQKTAGRIVLIELRRAINQSDPFDVSGKARNGFMSSTFTVSSGSAFLQVGGGFTGGPGEGANVGVSYWDAALGRPMSFFPRNKLGGVYGPLDYTATGWVI